jgi:cytochrome c oxidase assembly factor CtaG
MIRLALIGFVSRLAVGVALALLLALLLALVREDSSFVESFRVSVWLVGCLLLLLAVAGQSPTMRTGTIDPWLTASTRG